MGSGGREGKAAIGTIDDATVEPGNWWRKLGVASWRGQTQPGIMTLQ